MKNIYKLFLIILVLFFSCKHNKTENSEVEKQKLKDSLKKENELLSKNSNTDTTQLKKDSVTRDYSDIKIFWEDFKDAFNWKDKQKIAEMTYFPYLSQGGYVYKEEFVNNFNEYFSSFGNIDKYKTPKKSSMMFGGGLDSKGKPVSVDWKTGSLLATSIGGPTMYFGKEKGVYKFVATLYGE